MDDQRYVLPRPPSPWYQRISADRCFSIVAIIASLAAAAFTGWYAWDTHGMRVDAQEAAKKQANDVKLAREAAQRSANAAEKSATSADKLAEAMKESAGAAKKSAEAGLAALALNKRALILSNIPSMQVYSSRLLKPLTVGESPVVTTNLINGGKGTAVQLSVIQWIVLRDSFTFIYEPSPPSISTQDRAPGPGNILNSTVKLPNPLTAEQLQMVEAGKWILYEFGKATYCDNTLEHPRRYTWRWCNYYKPTNDGSDKLMLMACPVHNYTTEQ